MSYSDRYTPTQKQNVVYSDFLMDLNVHPIVGDVVKYNNEYAISSAIRNLLQTDKGERLYQPTVGSDVRRYLFEPISSAIAELISSAVQDTINTHEALRTKLIDVTVTPFEEKNLYVCTCKYYIVNRQEPLTVDITLSRVR